MSIPFTPLPHVCSYFLSCTFSSTTNEEYTTKGRVPKLKSAKVWPLTIEGRRGGDNF